MVKSVRSEVESEVLQQLVQAASSYHPSQFKQHRILQGNKWLAASCLQKSIRRGLVDTAHSAAAALLKIDPEYLFTWLGVIAYEDIGMANSELCGQVLLGKRKAIRKQVGESQVLHYLVEQCAVSVKDRTATDLLCLTIYDKHVDQLERQCRTSSPVQLQSIALDESLPLAHRASASKCLAGYRKFDEGRYEVLSAPCMTYLMDVCEELGVSPVVQYLVQAGHNKTSYLNTILPLVHQLISNSPSLAVVEDNIATPLVGGIKPIFVQDKLKRRSHFRTLPGAKSLSVTQIFEQEEASRSKAVYESPEHAAAKRMVADALRQRLQKGVAMPWYFKDPDGSQYHLAGNLLLGAEAVHTEESVKTSFGCNYRLDIAIVSKQISKEPILLGGVEIEWEHQFDGRKALIGKSQAFPLISIDISGMTLEEITPEWADTALTATAHSSDTGLRKTYVYLHELLYPLYLQLPSGLVKDTRHQFVVFAPDKDLTRLEKWAKELQDLVGLPKSAMAVSIVNAKSEQSKKMLENAGLVVGRDWLSINSQRCLMLTVERPSPVDVASHMFHLCAANLFLSYSDSLVGYKYMPGIHNEDPTEDIWQHPKWNPETKRPDYYRILPKRL